MNYSFSTLFSNFSPFFWNFLNFSDFSTIFLIVPPFVCFFHSFGFRLLELLGAYHRVGQWIMYVSNAWPRVPWHLLSTA